VLVERRLGDAGVGKLGSETFLVNLLAAAGGEPTSAAALATFQSQQSQQRRPQAL
jgi:hypothetical protein